MSDEVYHLKPSQVRRLMAKGQKLQGEAVSDAKKLSRLGLHEKHTDKLNALKSVTKLMKSWSSQV